MISRRKLIGGGVAAAGLVYAERLASRYGLIPPDSGGIWGAGETLTYATQRVLMSTHSMAREFNRSEISKVAPVSGEPPRTALFERLTDGGFADWRLRVDGLVGRQCSFSMEDLKRLPATSQITHQACEEGWSFIAEWTGVTVAAILKYAGVDPRAKYVAFFPFDEAWDSLDLADAIHPQTLLAYGLNGKDLPKRNGAPLRLRVPRQLGYKSVKFLSYITVTDTLKDFGKGLGSSSPEGGYSWFAGI